MNESPGQASPGSSPSQRPPEDGQHSPSPESPSEPPPNWAAEQPPSAGDRTWAVPSQRSTGRGGTGPLGKGRNGWNQQPTAPQPGVVPLRPLGVAEIFNGAVNTMRAHWRTLIGIAVAVAVVIQAVAAASTHLWMPDAGRPSALGQNPPPSPDEFADQLGGVLPALSLTLVVQQLGIVVITAFLTYVVSRAVLGRPTSFTEAWRDSRPQLPRLLGLLVLITLLVVAAVVLGCIPGFALLLTGAEAAGASLLLLGVVAGAVTSICIWLRFSLAAPSLMLEKQGVITAMRRSAKLVRRNSWRIFGVLLLAQLLTAALSSVFQLPASFLAVTRGESLDVPDTGGWPFLITSGLGEVLAYTIALPLTSCVTTLLYLDQRIRREALDLELARAAGITGYGDEKPGGHSSAG